MKFIKLPTDYFQSPEIQKLIGKLGKQGYGEYIMLLQYLASKVTKERDESFTLEHFTFKIPKAILVSVLATTPKRLEMFLGCSRDNGLIIWRLDDDVHEIQIPNLLKLLERDAKRTRPKASPDAAKPGLETDNVCMYVCKFEENEVRELVKGIKFSFSSFKLTASDLEVHIRQTWLKLESVEQTIKRVNYLGWYWNEHFRKQVINSATKNEAGCFIAELNLIMRGENSRLKNSLDLFTERQLKPASEPKLEKAQNSDFDENKLAEIEKKLGVRILSVVPPILQ